MKKTIYRAAVRLGLILVLCFQTEYAFAQDFMFSPEITEMCFSEVAFEDRLSCVGKAADHCMNTNEGADTTAGAAQCFDLEREWWDTQLNIAYQRTLELETQDDERSRDLSFAPQKVPALKAMQRAWITYRDALCEHEAVQWGGGTGTGPATLSCLMEETARQTQVLQQRLRDYR